MEQTEIPQAQPILIEIDRTVALELLRVATIISVTAKFKDYKKSTDVLSNEILKRL